MPAGLHFAGNHEEESEDVFGNDYIAQTGCEYPGHIGGAAGDCARSFMYAKADPSCIAPRQTLINCAHRLL